MSANATSSSTTKSPLEAAQKIVADLDGMTNEHRSLAVKFAMETLGLQMPGAFAPLASAAAHSAHSPPPHVVPDQPSPRMDIKAFTAVKGPKSDQQFAAVVAYFYQFEAPPAQRKGAIDAATMKDAARLAGRKQVKNWSVTLDNAKRTGYLDKAERGAYKLNAVGENLVAITLPGNAVIGQSNGRGSKKKPAKKKPTQGKSAKKG